MTDALDPEIPLICIRVANMNRAPVTARIAKCSICGETVWVALSSPGQAVLWCWECAWDQLDGVKDENIGIVMTERQLADVATVMAKRRK